MNAATALRARMGASFVARRGFSTTRTQLGSPYHYAEGPRSNIPFNPLTKFFFFRYWAFMITGFGAPFAIAGMPPDNPRQYLTALANSFSSSSLANLQGSLNPLAHDPWYPAMVETSYVGEFIYPV
ncbi:cytochrome c oxidase VIIc family protein [Aspergillus mulundensis]|uniref:Cytochrome c oxidase subunit 8, mitochondrial n=1 Tax=Aspergillus mulundensis TaxID=1810919 RepID=A0A3D8Q5P7_9EURO|nr:hypothetical protein DSM5745_11531 [Aspergillus mulundensis]RDW57133.1 hypothetical protein DSM5745_11531 [Aspergillus mulundensis]